MRTAEIVSKKELEEKPVFADDNVQANFAYTNSTTSAAVTYKDYSINIDKSAQQNGFKVTVDKAIATKHKLKVTLKIESEKPIEKMKHDNSIFEVTYGEENGNYGGHTSSSSEYINDKTMLVTLEKDNYEGEYPVKGEMRIDVVLIMSLKEMMIQKTQVIHYLIQ